MLAAMTVVSAFWLSLIPLSARAQEPAPQADWELVSRTPGISRLYTPDSGAFLARIMSEFLRSDDGGISSRTVPHPSNIQVMRVDPTDHQTLYATGAQKCSIPEPHKPHWQDRTTPVATFSFSSLPATTTAAPTLLPTAPVPEEVSQTGDCFFYSS